LENGSIFIYENALFMSLNGTPRLENGKAVIPVRVYSRSGLTLNNFDIQRGTDGIDYIREVTPLFPENVNSPQINLYVNCNSSHAS
jgi:hypothetical protein